MSDTPFKGLMGHFVHASPQDQVKHQGTRQGWVVGEDPPTIRTERLGDLVCLPGCVVVSNPPEIPGGIPVVIRRDDFRDLKDSYFEMCDGELERLLHEGASKAEVFDILRGLKGAELNGRLVRWPHDDDSDDDE